MTLTLMCCITPLKILKSSHPLYIAPLTGRISLILSVLCNIFIEITGDWKSPFQKTLRRSEWMKTFIILDPFFLSLKTKREQKNTFLIRSADLQQNGSICTYAGWCVLQKTEWILGFGNG